LHGTWLEAESFAYPAGGFTRRAYVEFRENPNNTPIFKRGTVRRRYVVHCSIPDTYFSIPARLRYRNQTIKGFITIEAPDTESAVYTFTPEGVS
jgi:hypothetical protein